MTSLQMRFASPKYSSAAPKKNTKTPPHPLSDRNFVNYALSKICQIKELSAYIDEAISTAPIGNEENSIPIQLALNIATGTIYKFNEASIGDTCLIILLDIETYKITDIYLDPIFPLEPALTLAEKTIQKLIKKHKSEIISRLSCLDAFSPAT